MFSCIWCKKSSSDRAIEHIIPEALGCPNEFVLSDGAVCRNCNNNLAHLDQAVIDDFDIFAFMSGVRGKRGKPREIHNRGNMLGTWDDNGKVISINMERYPVKSHDGRLLPKFGKSRRNIKASLRRSGEFADVSFDVRFGESPKFVRGIVKIAFSSLAYFIGPNEVLLDRFDSIRNFVISGLGVRKILLMPSSDRNYRNQVWPPYRHENGEYGVTFRLVAVEFSVDLSPDMTLFPIIKEKAYELYGPHGWSYLPV